MCSTPKLMYIKCAKDNKVVRPVLVPCGKCYACQCAKRAQTVLRVQAEAKSAKSVFFITLKYTNSNLRYYNDSPGAKRLAIKRVMSVQPRWKRDWNKFLLNPLDATQFIKDLQKVAKKFGKDCLFRYYLTGEYGTITHRPHMHLILFSPIAFTPSDMQKVISSVWKKGDAKVMPARPGSYNYIAKHQVKDDSGTEFQRKHSPIFTRTSRYKGGIGVSLSKDQHIIRSLQLGTRLYTNGKYTTTVPRYIRKKLGYNQQLNATELDQLSRDTLSNYDSLLYSQNKSPLDYKNLRQNILENNKESLTLDRQKKVEYENKRYYKKYRTHFTNSDNSKNDHF